MIIMDIILITIIQIIILQVIMLELIIIMLVLLYIIICITIIIIKVIIIIIIMIMVHPFLTLIPVLCIDDANKRIQIYKNQYIKNHLKGDFFVIVCISKFLIKML